MEFDVIRGDIADQRADALVNAAGTSLQMGSGVAGALRRGANGPINEAAVSKGPVDLGGVAVTDAYDLEADHVKKNSVDNFELAYSEIVYSKILFPVTVE